jgi:hypothetical protein
MRGTMTMVEPRLPYKMNSHPLREIIAFQNKHVLGLSNSDKVLFIVAKTSADYCTCDETDLDYRYKAE